MLTSAQKQPALRPSMAKGFLSPIDNSCSIPLCSPCSAHDGCYWATLLEPTMRLHFRPMPSYKFGSFVFSFVKHASKCTRELAHCQVGSSWGRVNSSHRLPISHGPVEARPSTASDGSRAALKTSQPSVSRCVMLPPGLFTTLNHFHVSLLNNGFYSTTVNLLVAFEKENRQRKCLVVAILAVSQQ